MKKTYKSYQIALLSLLLCNACASSKLKHGQGALDIKPEGGALNTSIQSIPSTRMNSTEDQPLGSEIAGIKLDVTKFDIPVTNNPRVEFWVKFFTGRGRNLFSEYIARLGKMAPMMIPKLKANGLPEDLVYLAMIESGFSSIAKSRAGATGPWQFMRSTGHLYGLRIDSWVDERRDPVKSTEAAIRYLSRLYDEFRDWELAAAAYNAGEGKIRGGISRYNTRDYWELARRRAIRPETIDYVPKMMAAAIITKNAVAFGFVPPEYDTMWTDTRTVALEKPEHIHTLAKVAKIHPKALKVLNPELLHTVTPPGKNYVLRVQNDAAKEIILAAYTEGELGEGKNYRSYAVRRGDTLSRIAQRFGVRSQSLVALNNISSTQRLRPGQVVVLPIEEASTRRRSIPKQIARNDNPARIFYTIRRGDTLYHISRRFDVSVQQLKKWNTISSNKSLRPGRQLRLYVKNDQTSI